MRLYQENTLLNCHIPALKQQACNYFGKKRAEFEFYGEVGGGGGPNLIFKNEPLWVKYENSLDTYIPVVCKHLSFKEGKESLGISRRLRMTREGGMPTP